MDDLHRILRPGGLLHALVPAWRHPNAVRDPTHVRFFEPLTFRYWTRPGPVRHRLWRPLLVTASDDTVFADLEPIPAGEPPDDEAIARCFG